MNLEILVMYCENAMFKNWRKPMLDNVTEAIQNIRCLNPCSNVCICFTSFYRFNLKLLVYMHGRIFTQLLEYPPLEMDDFQFV